MSLDKMGGNTPDTMKQNPTVDSLTKAETSFDAARLEFYGSAPDFSVIEECIEYITTQITKFTDDFTVILREEKK